MMQALRLAQRGEGCVEPNPMVGCVIVRDGRVLGEGWHKKFGGPHAEVVALENCRELGNDPVGAEVYVTLEPCCHHGKTPPCTDALIAARVGHVTAAVVDPFPRVAGGGIAALKAAGIAVSVGVCEAESRELLAPFLMRVKNGRPWVIAKWAQTIDGKTATSIGDSKWISNEVSRGVVHRVRARVDAVMLGVGTVVADDPMLNARGGEVLRVARRVVVDPSLRISEQAKLITTIKEAGPVTIGTRHDSLAREKAGQLRAAGVELVGLDSRWADDGSLGLNLSQLLQHLAANHNATNVLVEGGSRLVGSLMEQGLVDELMVFVGPMVLGDAAGLSSITGGQREKMVEARRWGLREVRKLGEDVMMRYRGGGEEKTG